MPVSVGSYSSEDLLQVWFISKLPMAKETLSRFSILNELLDSFSDYEKKLYKDTKNSIMFLCLPRFEGSNESQIKRLEKIEKTLSVLKVNKWSSIKYSTLKRRIANEQFDKSYSAQTEIEAVADMLPIVGEDGITLYPELKNGRYSDLRLVLDGRVIYIEIGNLAQSFPEKKINKILTDCVNHLGKQVSHCHLQVMVDTAGFKFSPNGMMDVPASIQQLISEIDGLKLSKLAGFEGFFDISEILWLVQNKELFGKIDFESENIIHSPFFGKLVEITKNPIAEKWMDSLDLMELQSAKIVKGIIGIPLPKEFPLLVEIHTEGIYPSKAGKAEIQSFINHLNRHAKDQLSQIQPEAPNIIAIRVDQFMLSSLSLFAEINNLQTGMHKLFDEIKNEHLSGIALYFGNITNAIFFANPIAINDSQLNKAEMTKLGLHFPTIRDFI